jgi:uncharacterized protein (DUF924 family)
MDDSPLAAVPAHVLAFWRDAGPGRWFARDDAFDLACRARLLDLHHRAARGELDDWAADAQGALALVLLLDQIPRNAYRDEAHAWATDGLARRHARRAIDAGHDRVVEPELRLFFYLPFEHSEALADQERSLALHRTLPQPDADAWALRHLEVIRRFGRFPHRNRALGREDTPDEAAWLAAGGGFG